MNLMHAYYFYAAVLAIKLLALIPMARLVCNRQKVQRANLSDLKHLTPFWLVAGLYITINPEPDLAVNLMRAFTVARLVSAIGYIYKLPRNAAECSFFVSFGITCFMGASVVYTYRSCL